MGGLSHLVVRMFVIDFEEMLRFAAFIVGGEFTLVLGSLEDDSFCFCGNITGSFLLV